jgi:hypothetical protein
MAALQVIADVGTWVVVLAPIWVPVAVLAYVARRKNWFGPTPGTYGTKAPARPPAGSSDT